MYFAVKNVLRSTVNNIVGAKEKNVSYYAFPCSMYEIILCVCMRI